MSAPKRVLLMVSSMRSGGSERQVLLLTKKLDRSRFQPHLYLTEATGDFLSDVPPDVPIHSYDQVESAKGIYFPGRELSRQTKYVQNIIQENAIDVVYERAFPMTLLGGKAALGKRRVATIVSPPEQAVPLVEKRFVWLKQRRLASAYRNADAVIAVSQQSAASARRYYDLPPDQVTVIRNPVDRESLLQASSSGNQLRTELTTFVCVGRMTAEKGQVDLIQALPEVFRQWPSERPPMKVRFVGDGPLRQALSAAADRAGVREHVEFIGSVSNAANEIANANALILPSRFEGMPNVVLEAMALETPVIATRAGGTVELQRDKPTAFWADAGDAQSIAAAILDFANHSDKAAQHINAATEMIQNDHCVETVVKQIEDLLSED